MTTSEDDTTRNLRVVSGDASTRPRVVIGSDPDAVRVLTRAVNDGHLGEVYVRHGVPVGVEQVSGAGPTFADDDTPASIDITEIKPAYLARLLADRMNVVRTKKGARGDVIVEEVMPTQSVLGAVLAGRRWDGLPPLVKVVTSPVLRPDGSLLQTPGYDRATGFYLAASPGAGGLPPVPERPTARDVQQAKQFLLEVFLGDFPWKSSADKANYAALMASPILRSFLRSPMPFTVVDATMPGSGKTILTSCIGLLVGQRVLTWPDAEDELRKAITTVLAEPVGVIVFDNLAEGSVIDSAVLARLVTEKTWSDRRLGTNSASSFVQDRLWCATGNNLRLGGDMASRSVWVQLDPDCPNPEQRQGFSIPNLDAWIMQPANQAQVLYHLLVLILDWVNAGAPASPEVPTMRQFTPWAKALGGWCHHHGITGFLANHAATKTLDDDEAEWRMFLLHWHTVFGAGKVTAAELVKSAEPGEFGRDEWSGTFPTTPTGRAYSVKGLGKKLTGQIGRWRTDVVLRTVTDTATNTKLYYVQKNTPTAQTPKINPVNPVNPENPENHPPPGST